MKNKTSLVMIWLPLVALAFILIFYQFRNKSHSGNAGEYSTYERHYALITDKGDEDFWNEVYESALKEGKERGVYVERFGDSLAVDYDRDQLLDMALRAAVDGIIVAGDETEQTVELINQAVKQEIPVVTVLNDCIESNRQCFVGSNSYNIGQEYGEQILQMLPEGSGRVMVLTDDSQRDSSQNLILLAIRETLEKSLGNQNQISVETRPIEGSRSFSAEESIRDIFLDEELPNVLVCLNAVHTRCAYTAAVDYNKVGTVQILGYYNSEAILEAVSKNIIQATVGLDTVQMGELCVQALDEYVETGYTNSYMAVDIYVITPEEAKELTERNEIE